MISHGLCFLSGVAVGWLWKSYSIGEDPNTIWENSKAEVNKVGNTVTTKATEVKDTVTEKVTEIKGKTKKAAAQPEVLNADGTPAK